MIETEGKISRKCDGQEGGMSTQNRLAPVPRKGVHRYAADEENGTAVGVYRKRHHRAEREAWEALGMGR